MKKKERERLKLVVYEAYMAGQARGENTEEILEALEKKFGVCSRTLQNYIYDVDKGRKATMERLEHLEEGLRMVASGNYCVDEDTRKIKEPEPIPMISQDGRLLV